MKSKFMHILITNIFCLLLEERSHNYTISTVSIVPFFSKSNSAYRRAKSGFTSRISRLSLDKNDFSLHKCKWDKDYTEMVWAFSAIHFLGLTGFRCSIHTNYTHFFMVYYWPTIAWIFSAELESSACLAIINEMVG